LKYYNIQLILQHVLHIYTAMHIEGITFATSYASSHCCIGPQSSLSIASLTTSGMSSAKLACTAASYNAACFSGTADCRRVVAIQGGQSMPVNGSPVRIGSRQSKSVRQTKGQATSAAHRAKQNNLGLIRTAVAR
jgi:hypothetical protein